MSALQVFLDSVNVAADFFTVVMLLDVVALFIMLFIEATAVRSTRSRVARAGLA